MKRDQVTFLLGGLVFGILIGYGVFHAVTTQPELAAVSAAGAVPAPRGPQAPTQVAPTGAPMVAEINQLKRMLEESPENVEILLRLANIYHDAAMWDRAVGYYERVIAVRPDDPDVLTDLGVCYRGLGSFDRALESFTTANRANPAHWQSLFNMAVVAAFDLGQFEVANEALAAIDAMDPPPAGLDPNRLEQLREAAAHVAEVAADAS